MKNYLKALHVKPGSKIKLKDYDSGGAKKRKSRQAARPEIEKLKLQMARLQYLMYAENRHSLLIVLQGMDASGKDGVIRHVLSGVNPQGCTVTGFKQPTLEESRHDFLWRVHPHAPQRGTIAIFNRSHYEDVLVARVHRLVPEREWSRRYGLINDFEKLLVTENNTTILKFFLDISEQEQLARFERRLDDPARNWKISESDYLEREYWDDYMEAYEAMLHKTSTEHAPWFVIPSDHKWFRDLTISRIIVGALGNLRMKQPAPSVDLNEIRREYHDAKAKAR